MSTERDTHFQGAAKLLYEDFLQLAREDESSMNEMFAPTYPENWRMKVEQLIAQRAYDLVNYALEVCPLESFEILGGAVQDVPDLTEWPKFD